MTNESPEDEQSRQLLTANKVAFSAALSASGELRVGPSNDYTTLVYKHVMSNIGNAYNPLTGFFTAPVKGAYYFDFSVAVFGPRRSAALLVKNGVNVVAASEHPASGLSGTSNAVILTLKAGDLVSVQLWPTFQVFDNDNHHTTFTGFLLFPM